MGSICILLLNGFTFFLGNIEIYDVSTGESELIKVLDDSKYNKMLNISVLEKAINNIHSSITQVVYNIFSTFYKTKN